MKPSTESTKASMMKRLAEVFGEESLPYLTYRDYELVKSELGWAESTFKTALRYLGNDTGNLRDGFRDYIPTLDEIRTLMEHVNRPMVATLAMTGCRFGQLWMMNITPNTLIIRSQKGGNVVMIPLRKVSPEARQLIEYWVTIGCTELTQAAARKRWQRAMDAGLVDQECTPHSLRHRVATLLAESGEDTDTIGDVLGHKNRSTTRAYRHKSIGQKLEEVMLPKGEGNVQE